MRSRSPLTALVAVLAVAALAAPATPAAAEPSQPGLFTVLQAAYYSFGQSGPANVSADHRVVLLEQTSPASGGAADFQHNASDKLVNSTTRDEFVLVEYQVPAGSNALASSTAASRFSDYYQAELVPTSIFDGTQRAVAFAPNTVDTFSSALASEGAVPAGASIGASGGTVAQFGYLDVEATATQDISATRAYLRAVLVEDHVKSPADGRDLRFIARIWLGNVRLVDGHASGRFNFTIDPSWVDARLAVVLFVQSDGPVEGTPPPTPAPPADLLRDIVVPLAPWATLAALGLLIGLFTRRERRRHP